MVLFATSGGSTVDKANKDFAASYPAIKRKEDWKDNISFVGVHSAGAIRVTKGIQ